MRTKRTIKLDDMTYYQQRPDLSDEDDGRLGRLLANVESFKAWTGGKFCGGYHADYAIEWRVGKDVYRAHVCLGCHEIKFFTTDTELYCDIAEEAHERLAAILTKYRRNRPLAD